MEDADAPAAAGPFPGLGQRLPVEERTFSTISDDGARPDRGSIAEEVPVAFVYQKRTHAVMMATPADLEDLAVGFTLSEQIVPRAADITRVEVARHSRGIEIGIDIPAACADALVARARALAGRTGCGLCGVEAIDDAVRTPVQVSSTLVVSRDALWRAAAALDAGQPFNRDTHAIRVAQAAAWIA